MSAEAATIAEPKGAHRAAVSNGSRVLANVDGRSMWARRLRDVIEAHIADLGGSANVSEAERSIVRRAAVLTIALEQMETAFALAGIATAAEIDAYQRAASGLRRLLEAVGIQRRQRNVTPDPLAYARAKADAG